MSIDLSVTLKALEAELCGCTEPSRISAILFTLLRWAGDGTLDQRSRDSANKLIAPARAHLAGVAAHGDSITEAQQMALIQRLRETLSAHAQDAANPRFSKTHRQEPATRSTESRRDR